MSAKLGNGLYWLACIVAVLVLLLGSSVVFTALPQSIVGRNPLAAYVVLLAGAFVVWLIGRGLRYILAGPPAPLKEDQLVERISKLEQRIDAVDTHLARFEETVGPQLKTIADLLRSALSATSSGFALLPWWKHAWCGAGWATEIAVAQRQRHHTEIKSRGAAG